MSLKNYSIIHREERKESLITIISCNQYHQVEYYTSYSGERVNVCSLSYPCIPDALRCWALVEWHLINIIHDALKQG